jgi:hypothetical protein
MRPIRANFTRRSDCNRRTEHVVTPPLDAKEIERVAKALYEHRYGDSLNGPWHEFIGRKPDIAEIYRENAKVAIAAYRQAS